MRNFLGDLHYDHDRYDDFIPILFHDGILRRWKRFLGGT